jgi:hypothetical protein
MPWRFVGRTEQLDRIHAALSQETSGPIVITGERGIGRSAVLSRALENVDTGRDTIIRAEPVRGSPFATLRPFLPDDLPAQARFSDAVPIAAQAIVRRSAGRRLLVALDDAHLADQLSLLTLRELSRHRDAVLLITRPITIDAYLGPDPTECLRYEQDIHTVGLSPLGIDEVATLLAGVVRGHVHPATTEALYAATGGKPRLLHDFVVGNGLVQSMTRRNGVWRLGQAPPRMPAYVELDGVTRLVDAARQAWQDLAIDRADQLCRLATWHGATQQVAAIRANVLLLRGRAEDGMRFLDSLPSNVLEGSAELILAKTMTLAVGLGDASSADEVLLHATSRNADLRDRLLAYRAWILAVIGRAGKAAEALESINRSDRETAVYMHAARAALALSADLASEAVFHLRRALATAEACPGISPWLAPYLTACLIDAMMLAGRLGEATGLANGFHAGEPGSGWEIAVTLSALVAGRRPGLAAPDKLRTA